MVLERSALTGWRPFEVLVDASADYSLMQKLFIVLGFIILAIGIAWPWLSKLPIGRLPGDIALERPGFKFFFPITTMIVISVVVSLLLWFFRR